MKRHPHLVVLLLTALVVSSAAAQSSQQSVPPESTPEARSDDSSQTPAADADNQVVVPLSEPARRWIEQALRQQAADPSAAPRSTGDPILDDVLDVIRRQGSLLDGSSLDERRDERREAILSDSTDDDAVPLPALPGAQVIPPPPSPDLPSSIQHRDARFHAAESLLRAARELAALGNADRASVELIAAMREQATMLLVDEYSEVLERLED